MKALLLQVETVVYQEHDLRKSVLWTLGRVGGETQDLK